MLTFPLRRVLLAAACGLVVAALVRSATAGNAPALRHIEADDKRIQYTGRIDFSDPKRPRFWAPGVYLKTRFVGPTCDLLVNDEVLWGKSHNYLEIALDDQKSFRVQTTAATNRIRVAEGLSNGTHTLTVCKDTEAGIGYVEVVGLECQGLAKPPPRPPLKLEFFGDSITCGAESDLSKAACGTGEWYDRHNAYGSYGATTARLLNAEWHLSSVSGIGLQHSCCNMKITLPDVWDTLNFQPQSKKWDVSRYQPDAVMICLGQNDGIQPEPAFTDRYVAFVQTLRKAYPKAQIVCLTSPMGDTNLTKSLQAAMTRVVDRCHTAGDAKVSSFFFSRQYHRGCGGHPDLIDHQQIAQELTGYLRPLLARHP